MGRVFDGLLTDARSAARNIGNHRAVSLVAILSLQRHIRRLLYPDM
jgi:hypothetical protein